MAKKTTKAVAKSKKAYKLTVGENFDKEKDIDVVDGATTVAEAWRLAGFDVPGDKTAEELGMRLNGHPCKWTDKISGSKPTLYKLPKGKAGSR